MTIKSISPYGGDNKNSRPFSLGQKVRQKNGTEEYEVVGYEGDQIIIKPLNDAAFWQVDTLAPHVIENMKKIRSGKPSRESLRLHVMYADRWEEVNEK